ncbi:MAG: thioredoxin fold domain-containing protein [Candidatus Sedimenticola sp. (ex Thyasira tokunagai)]
MKQYLTLVATLLIITSLQAISSVSASEITLATDWEAEAMSANSNQLPVMVVFSSEGCVYCDKLKSDLLKPLMQDGELDKQVHINEFNISSGGKVVDFDGDRIRSRIFVDRYKIYATPTVVLLDYNGNQLTPPIIGYNNVAEYKDFLATAIKDAQASLNEL